MIEVLFYHLAIIAECRILFKIFHLHFCNPHHAKLFRSIRINCIECSAVTDIRRPTVCVLTPWFLLQRRHAAPPAVNSAFARSLPEGTCIAVTFWQWSCMRALEFCHERKKVRVVDFLARLMPGWRNVAKNRHAAWVRDSPYFSSCKRWDQRLSMTKMPPTLRLSLISERSQVGNGLP